MQGPFWIRQAVEQGKDHVGDALPSNLNLIDETQLQAA